MESALRRSPDDVGLSVGIWEGKTLSAYLQHQFEIDLGVRQCQRIFRQLGFRHRKPRPVRSEVPPEVKAAAKKLRALNEDPSLDLWAMDEVRLQ